MHNIQYTTIKQPRIQYEKLTEKVPANSLIRGHFGREILPVSECGGKIRCEAVEMAVWDAEYKERQADAFLQK